MRTPIPDCETLGRVSGRSLQPDENERLRTAVQELVDQEGNKTKAAKRLGVSQPTISSFLNGRQGGSYQLAAKVAELLGRDLSTILNVKPTPASERPVRYSNLERAAEAARILGIDEEAIEIVRSVSLQSDEDLDPETWLDQIRAEARRLRFLAKGGKPLGVRVVKDDDDL